MCGWIPTSSLLGVVRRKEQNYLSIHLSNHLSTEKGKWGHPRKLPKVESISTLFTSVSPKPDRHLILTVWINSCLWRMRFWSRGWHPLFSLNISVLFDILQQACISLHNFLKAKFNPFSHIQIRAVTKAVLRNESSTGLKASTDAQTDPIASHSNS